MFFNISLLIIRRKFLYYSDITIYTTQAAFLLSVITTYTTNAHFLLSVITIYTTKASFLLSVISISKSCFSLMSLFPVYD